MVADHSYNDLTIYRRLFRQTRAFFPHLAGIFLIDLLATPLLLLSPIPLKIAVDSIIGSAPLPGFFAVLIPNSVIRSAFWLLVIVAFLQVLIVLLSQLQELSTYVLRTYTGEKLTLNFRQLLFQHVQHLSLSFHDLRGTADSVYRIQYDAPAIQYTTIYGAIPLISSTVTLVVTIYVIARLNWQLACVALAVSPFLFVFSRVFSRRVRARYKDVKELESSALNVVQQVLTALRVVKAFGREGDEQEHFTRHSSAGMSARISLSFSEGLFGLLINLTTALGTAAVLVIGVRSVQSGTLTLGELLLVISYLAQLYSPLKTMSKTFANVQSSIASAERAFELLDEVPEVAERTDAQPLKRAVGDIEFQHISFAYDSKHEILRDVSLRIPAGTRLGISGRTGAGKTTLVSLVTRFYDPTAGQILLDGRDLRDYKLADLRNQFAIVLQEPVLFSTSIAENIAYARPDATPEEIAAAAQAANAHEFISNLPEGYETQVGERGLRLSGGERQRISLARAFLKDAPILILDEPTSSVDLRTEAAIMEAMERLMRGRTTLMIAHRLSTLEHCNMSLNLEQGRIALLEQPHQQRTGETALASNAP